MDQILRFCTLGLLGLAVLTGGCGGKTAGKEPDSHFTANCIAVLPPALAADPERQPSAAEEKVLHDGVHALDKALKAYFSGRDDVRMLSGESVSNSWNSLERAKAAAAQSGCNAVLATALNRYEERIGGAYTAKEPAAAGFSYRLLAMPEGRVLCLGRFDEEQLSLMENLLNFSTSAENSFAWVTAERLLTQALRDRLDSCPYLEKK